MNQKVSTAIKYVLSLALAGLLLHFSFRGVDWKAFVDSLSTCNWGYVVLSMTAGALAFVVRGFRWKQLIAPIDPTIDTMTTINGVNISNVANMIIPYCGEFIRCGVVTRNSKKVTDSDGRRHPVASYDKILGTAMLERVFDILSVVVLLAVLLIFMSGRFGQFMTEKIWGPISRQFKGSMGFIIAALIILGIGCIAAIYRYRNSSRLCGRIYGAIARFAEGFASCLKIEKAWLFFAYTAIIWMFYWLQIVLLTSAMPQTAGMGVIDALFIMLVGSFASCLPVPGGFGAYHYIVSVALFSLYGLPQAGLGIVFATLAHESQALTMILTGLFSYLYESFRKRQDA